MRPDNGLVPCSGFHGFPCAAYANVKENKQKCRTCWDLQAKPPPEPNFADPWTYVPPPPPPPAVQLAVRPMTSQEQLLAMNQTEELAMALAWHGQEGFVHCVIDGPPVMEFPGRTLYFKSIYRLALIADNEVVPKEVRKQASHCGGVEPRLPLLEAFQDTPKLADPGNRAYSVLVDMLLDRTRDEVAFCADVQTQVRIQFLQTFNMEHKGDVVEAALAAADCAYKKQEGVPMMWEELEGGAHADGDLPT